MEDKKAKLKPGEKGFSVILLLLIIGLFVESIKMFREDRTSASFGALPLFLSALMTILMLKIILLENRSKKWEGGKASFKEVLKYAFQKDMIVMFFMILAYCIALYFGLGFELSSTLFLLVAMTYFMGKKSIFMNVIYTAIVILFIGVVFKVAFQVVLP